MLSLTYVSSATDLVDPPRLLEMLAAWRPRNHALELTGMLLYSGGNIIQALEGPDAAVEAMFATISADPRHRGVLVLDREPLDERAFPDWSMGFRHLRSDEIGAAEGLTPFLQQPPGPEADHDPGRAESSALQLLETFRRSMR